MKKYKESLKNTPGPILLEEIDIEERIKLKEFFERLKEEKKSDSFTNVCSK